MKKIITFILIVFASANIAYAQNKSATTFVSNLVDEVINEVLATDNTKEEKSQKFEEIILSKVDTEAIARTVLAQYWRTATPKEKDDFIEAFKNMAIKMTAERFGMYNGQEVKFYSERPAQGKNQVFVESSISSDSKPIQVMWRVRQKDGKYSILDIIVEGVSMTLTYRNEYTTYLQNHSINDLIKELEHQTQNAAEIFAQKQSEKKK
ncbi:MAG: ABC transporter substrate-binding protein [Alphaproteobacteria bacterium]|nr:ABC transporter substrate-binding protein [Alphaproteobacteria bacterium]